MKALTPSAALAAVVGATPLPRTEVVSKMWVYIKKHNLQDSVNRRAINADDKLKAVFGKAQVTMFEMAGLIGKHLKSFRPRRIKKPALAGFFMASMQHVAVMVKTTDQTFCLASAAWVMACKVPRVVITSGSSKTSIKVPSGRAKAANNSASN